MSEGERGTVNEKERIPHAHRKTEGFTKECTARAEQKARRGVAYAPVMSKLKFKALR